MAEKNMLVQVDPARRKEIEEIAEGLEKLGMKVSTKLRTTGIISGRADDALTAKLRALDGVLHIRDDETVTLPPFDDEKPQ